MSRTCVFCGQPNPGSSGRYCSPRCAERQIRAIGALLQSTPRPALSVAEWHDLSADYASDLQAQRLVAVA